MKINNAIFAVDDNINYQGFWEINSEICKKNLNITPVLFKITDEETDFYEDKFGLVKHIKKIPNVNNLPFFTFFMQKGENFIFRPAFGVCSTQTLVKIYNTACVLNMLLN